MAMPVKAEEEDSYFQKIGDFYYYLIFDSDFAELVPASNDEYKYMEVVRIPDTVYYKGKSYTVEHINANAFGECYRLKSVTLPKTIFRIDDYAFYGCYNLVSINLENVLVIGDRAFYLCGSSLNRRV